MRKWNRLTFLRLGLVGGLLSLHFLTVFNAARQKSPTADEYSYVATGYLYDKTWDFRLDRTHPPLIRLLIGLPLQFLHPWTPPLQEELWDTPLSYTHGYQLGWEMLLGGHNRWETLLLWSRLPIVLLSCGLALLIYAWARDLYGEAGGCIALFFYCFCPNMAAHAGLATMDLGISFFYFCTLYLFYRYWKSRRVADLVFCGCALGLALTAKVTALLLIPVVTLAGLWAVAPEGKSLKSADLKMYLRRTIVMWIAALATLLLIYGYPFRACYFWDTATNVFYKSSHATGGGGEIPGMPHFNYAFYLWGNYSSQGWPYYFLLAALVKTPLPVWIALLLVLLFTRRRWIGLPDFLIVGGIAVLHFAAVFNRVNIGVRHVLPFYPLLYLYMGRLADLWKGKILRTVLLLLGLWYVGEYAWIYPDYLAYFNELAGGPANGQTVLDDSNLDWGQDLGDLQAIQKQYPNEPFYVATNWMFVPRAFHVEAKLLTEAQIAEPPKGIVAVGKHWAIRHRIHPRSPYYFDWLEKYRPFGEVGHSILLYRF